MTITINSSFQSIGTSANTKSTLATNLERIASGKKLNSAKDDAARLAIAQRFLTQISGNQQAYKNINDGISISQTAEASVADIGSNVQRIRELAIQSANGSLGDGERKVLQQEVSDLQSEISRITGSTEFNGISLLNNASAIKFQIGANEGDTLSVNSPDLESQLSTIGIGSIDISTAAGAQAAIGVTDTAFEALNKSQTEYGAIINRFESVAKNLSNLHVSMEEARSRIEDADVAQEMAALTRNKILNQAQNAAHSQANISAHQVLQFLE